MTIIVGCGHFYVAVYKLFMWSTILGRAPGARNWSHPHPWTICLCQIPSAWVCQEQHIENIYQDCSSSGLWADCIAKYNIVLQSIEKYCRGLLWTMGEARHIESQWNEMHSNPSSLSLCTWYCSPSEWKVASRLFLAGTICQFVLFCIATINHHACMYAHDQIFVKPERKTGKSNKSCAHVWKKRPWLGRSEATCHQIDPVTRQPVVVAWWWYANWSLTSASYRASH